MNAERRRFNTSERVAAFLIADGKCEDCGAELKPGWHGDHDIPFSLGGETDAINIRALCPKCNLKKGNKMRERLGEWPAKIDGKDSLREWHREAFDRFIQHESCNFLAVATPGAGKTRFALRCAHLLLSAGKVDRVVVIVPSSHLRNQWVNAATQCGIDLNGDFENRDGRESRDYHGIVVTYQAIASYPDLHRGLCRDRTLVIFDEVHHAGTNMMWGDAVQHAFDPAAFRLCISGTPFRRDNNPIPFIRYESNSSVADYEYGYADALRDDVCRTVYFPAFEGEISWLSDDEMRTHTFDDDLTEEEAGHRLRAALLAPTWMEDVIRDAHGELMRIRDDEPDAAGLLIAMDQSHAKEAARLIKKVTGYDPVIAISEDEDASRRIVEFERGSSPWIVAVKMVSEGVDIPRLRVCAYASNVTSALFFRQAIGRIVRRRGDEDTDAYFFIPKDKRLVLHALEVKHERDHVLREQRQAVQREMEGGDGQDVERPRMNTPIIAYDATARPDGAIHDGVQYDQALIERVTPIAKRLGIAAVKLAAATDDLLALLENKSSEPAQAASEPARISKDERRAQLRNVAKKLASRWAYILEAKTKRSYQDCIKYVNNACLDAGHKSPRQSDEDGLKRRIEYLGTKLREAGDGSV